MAAPAPSASRVFVSHSHQDNAYCREFVAGLRVHGYAVCYDEHNLGWGALRPTIEQELPKCAHFVAILSPAAVASEWVNTEIDAALDLLGKRVLHTFTFVVAAACEVPLLLRRWKRIARERTGRRWAWRKRWRGRRRFWRGRRMRLPHPLLASHRSHILSHSRRCRSGPASRPRQRVRHRRST